MSDVVLVVILTYTLILMVGNWRVVGCCVGDA